MFRARVGPPRSDAYCNTGVSRCTPTSRRCIWSGCGEAGEVPLPATARGLDLDDGVVREPPYDHVARHALYAKELEVYREAGQRAIPSRWDWKLRHVPEASTQYDRPLLEHWYLVQAPFQ